MAVSFINKYLEHNQPYIFSLFVLLAEDELGSGEIGKKARRFLPHYNPQSEICNR
jgi:hypothetical protein